MEKKLNQFEIGKVYEIAPLNSVARYAEILERTRKDEVLARITGYEALDKDTIRDITNTVRCGILLKDNGTREFIYIRHKDYIFFCEVSKPLSPKVAAENLLNEKTNVAQSIVEAEKRKWNDLNEKLKTVGISKKQAYDFLNEFNLLEEFSYQLDYTIYERFTKEAQND